MSDPRWNVLILCTGNSARSILAEAVLGRVGTGRFRAFSAGSQPRGEVHDVARSVLRAHGHAIGHLRSKSWDEFAAPGAPALDVVITVCDAAAGESCPIWPGAPLRAHWGLPDPSAAPPAEQPAAFERTYQEFERRFHELMERTTDAADSDDLKRGLAQIRGIAERGDPRPR
jgi:protein-tyrosine-phosphatase